MFAVGDTLTYLPGGIQVTVTEVHNRHIIVTDNETGWTLDPIYEDEYSDYVVD